MKVLGRHEEKPVVAGFQALRRLPEPARVRAMVGVRLAGDRSARFTVKSVVKYRCAADGSLMRRHTDYGPSVEHGFRFLPFDGHRTDGFQCQYRHGFRARR